MIVFKDKVSLICLLTPIYLMVAIAVILIPPAYVAAISTQAKRK